MATTCRRISRRRFAAHLWWGATLASLLLLPACRQKGDLPHYFGEPRPAKYLNRATQIAYTDLEEPVSPDVDFATPPRRISDRREDEIWDLTLEQVVHTALLNSDIIRSSGQFLSPGNPLLNNPEFVPSVYDPAIQESGVLFGRRGVEAALSDFDTQFTTQLLYGRNETRSKHHHCKWSRRRRSVERDI